MAKIPETVIDDVLNQTNITDVVSKYVNLKKSGNNLFGLCPFHEERTPSFSVSESKQIFHCFSCGRGGNVFKFLMDLQGISFPEAVIAVANDEGIKLPDSIQNGGDNSPVHTEKNNLIQLQEEAAKLYHHVLVNTELGVPALKYLHDRKITDDMIETFNLGFAPGQQLLKPFFENKKADYQLLRKSGLFIENSDGELNDRFTNRIMYPIRNDSSKTVGFSGRVLHKDPDIPKYLNSPETSIFNKRKIIYNIDLAKPSIRNEQNLILFEGFMDVISAYQAGVKNGVASMGTSLTNKQIYQFNQLTNQVYVCYDGDDPGQKATKRAISLLGDEGQFTVGVIQMPNGIDPDEYRRKYGNDKFKDAIKSARETTVSFELRFLKTQYDLSNDEEKLNYVDAALNVIAKIDKPVERSVYLKQLSDEFELDMNALTVQCKQIRSTFINKRQRKQVRMLKTDTVPEVLNQNPKKITRVESAERLLLSRMLNNRNVWLKVTDDPEFSFVHDQYQTIYLLAQHYFQNHDHYSAAEFSDFLKESDLQSTLANIEMAALSNEPSEKEIDDCVRIIRQALTGEVSLKTKHQAMMDAVKLGDIEKAAQLGKEYQDLQKKYQ
ncbi:DNA primase [Fructilactobacillus fructivorans]|uniref:DNA primase n=1 Tax=Fructilactobacillus fructivorans TaxID=1614 RepID=UPI000704AEF6|nr:DNA primase [Fructilactobacillus fructivorans]KRN43422.1 DNA primase [Fructilactobacillus fructivorans]